MGVEQSFAERVAAAIGACLIDTGLRSNPFSLCKRVVVGGLRLRGPKFMH
jgi:hypothetical protein